MSGLEQWHMHLRNVRNSNPTFTYKKAQQVAKKTYRLEEKKKCKKLIGRRN